MTANVTNGDEANTVHPAEREANGLAKYKTSDPGVMPKLRTEWHALTPEEQKEIAEEKAKELAKKKAAKNKETAKNGALQVAADAQKTLEKIKVEVRILSTGVV